MEYKEIKELIQNRLTQFVIDEKTLRLEQGEYSNEKVASLKNPITFYKDYDIDKAQDNDIAYVNALRNANMLFPELNIPEDDTQKFLKEFMRQYPDVCQKLLKFNSNPEDIDFGKVIRNNSSNNILLETAISEFMQEHELAGSWVHGTKLEKEISCNLLLEILGNINLSDLSMERARYAKDVLIKLPLNRKKNKKTRNLSLKKSLEVEGVKKISVTTVNKYLTDFIMLGNWLERNGYLEKNFFEGLKIKVKKTNGNKKPFTLEQVGTILTSLEDKSIKESRYKFRYWASLIAIYTGARANEIAQLHVSDIVERDGFLCFSFANLDEDEDGKKRRKNEHSTRLVPVHSYLLDKGFIEFCENQKELGLERLFPKLTYEKKSGYGRKLSYWFNNVFLKDIGIKTPALTLHCFRHTLVTNLSEIEVSDAIRDKITGHKGRQNIAEKFYNKAENIKAMKNALEKLPY